MKRLHARRASPSLRPPATAVVVPFLKTAPLAGDAERIVRRAEIHRCQVYGSVADPCALASAWRTAERLTARLNGRVLTAGCGQSGRAVAREQSPPIFLEPS